MTGEILVRGPTALLPVLLFLGALVYLDSFKLVSARMVAGAMAVGAIAAGLSYPANSWILDHVAIGFQTYSRYVSPWLEETLKAAVMVFLVRTRRIGLLVDAAIAGFAIGTGFALVENLYYIASRPDAAPAVQVIRGFGTAIMHGGATAMFGVVSVALYERRPDGLLSVFLPGLLAAATLHSGFNHLLFRPVIATLVTLLALPGIIYFVFQSSENSLRDWLESDLDSDLQLIDSIHSGDFSASHAGAYLNSLKGGFRGEVVADMLCYLRLHVELALRAKGILLLRESGIAPPPLDEDTQSQLAEMQYLEKSIGRTGQLALRPLLVATGKDLWQLSLLEQAQGSEPQR
jgi:RsiW-degrading membrane proteinase PrsW (M82 family)